jgi:membrane protein implicated in regulation of membrane protease activity
MTDWIVWLGLAGILVILEMFAGTFYLLMIGVGFVSGAIAAFMEANLEMQLVVAAAIGMVATYALRRSRFGKYAKTKASRDVNVNLDIGQTLFIDTWKNREGQQHTARVMYRGAPWDVELEADAVASPGLFTISEMRGSCLIVTNVANSVSMPVTH